MSLTCTPDMSADEIADLCKMPTLIDPPKAHKWQCNSKKLHLTYPMHVDLPELLAHLCIKLGDMKWYSFVHENGTGEHGVAYQHTHAAFELVNKKCFSSERLLDFCGLHPNIKAIKTPEQARNTWLYHLKDPVKILQSATTPLISTIEAAIDADTLLEGVQMYGIEVKTVGDLNMLRNARNTRQKIPKLIDAGAFKFGIRDECMDKTIFIFGPTGVGKTQWAIAQFEHPLLISHMDDLKQLNIRVHDGIVFDDLSFANVAANVLIHLTDWDLPRSINVKHSSVTIPAHTRKIITSNLSLDTLIMGMEPEHKAAIKRRVHVIHQNGSLFWHFGTVGYLKNATSDFEDMLPPYADDIESQISSDHALFAPTFIPPPQLPQESLSTQVCTEDYSIFV